MNILTEIGTEIEATTQAQSEDESFTSGGKGVGRRKVSKNRAEPATEKTPKPGFSGGAIKKAPSGTRTRSPSSPSKIVQEPKRSLWGKKTKPAVHTKAALKTMPSLLSILVDKPTFFPPCPPSDNQAAAPPPFFNQDAPRPNCPPVVDQAATPGPSHFFANHAAAPPARPPLVNKAYRFFDNQDQAHFPFRFFDNQDAAPRPFHPFVDQDASRPNCPRFVNEAATPPACPTFVNQAAASPACPTFINQGAAPPTFHPFVNQDVGPPNCPPFVNQDAASYHFFTNQAAARHSFHPHLNQAANPAYFLTFGDQARAPPAFFNQHAPPSNFPPFVNQAATPPPFFNQDAPPPNSPPFVNQAAASPPFQFNQGAAPSAFRRTANQAVSPPTFPPSVTKGRPRSSVQSSTKKTTAHPPFSPSDNAAARSPFNHYVNFQRLEEIIVFNVRPNTGSEELTMFVHRGDFRMPYEYFRQEFVPLTKVNVAAPGESWLVAISQIVRDELLQLGRLTAFAKAHQPVAEYITMIRCFHCQKFGHRVLTCTAASTCSNCAEYGHQYEMCKYMYDPKCANCKRAAQRYDHDVRSKSCPAYLKHRRGQ